MVYIEVIKIIKDKNSDKLKKYLNQLNITFKEDDEFISNSKLFEEIEEFLMENNFNFYIDSIYEDD